MRKILIISIIVLLSIPLVVSGKKPPKPCPLPPAEGEEPAYTEIEVTNGGALSGTVSFEGEYVPKKWKSIKDADFCGASVADESLVAGSEGGLRYVVVTITDIKEGKALPKVVKEMANKDCLYQPHVETLCVCDKVMVTNHDPILHNTHAYIGDVVFEPQKPKETDDGLLILSEGDAAPSDDAQPMVALTTLFNLGLPTMDFKPKKTMRQPGLVTLKCDAGHTWMTGFLWVEPHPYSTVTDEKGNFKIEDIPAGEYQIKFWHEKMGEQTHKVTIKESETTKLDTKFTLKK